MKLCIWGEGGGGGGGGEGGGYQKLSDNTCKIITFLRNFVTIRSTTCKNKHAKRTGFCAKCCYQTFPQFVQT